MMVTIVDGVCWWSMLFVDLNLLVIPTSSCCCDDERWPQHPPHSFQIRRGEILVEFLFADPSIVTELIRIDGELVLQIQQSSVKEHLKKIGEYGGGDGGVMETHFGAHGKLGVSLFLGVPVLEHTKRGIADDDRVSMSSKMLLHRPLCWLQKKSVSDQIGTRVTRVKVLTSAMPSGYKFSAVGNTHWSVFLSLSNK